MEVNREIKSDSMKQKLFITTPFDLRHLTSSSSTFYFTPISEGLTTLSEETTQRKHTYVTPNFPSLTNQLLQLKLSYTKPHTKTLATKWFPLAKQ